MQGYRDGLNGRVLIAAHRGVAGGNIQCNTLRGFQAALGQGADVIELDVSLSLDGTPYIFHPGKEMLYLHSSRPIAQLHDREVDALTLYNMDGASTGERVPRLADGLAFLRGRCRVNVDKFWTDIPRLAGIIRDAGMADQVIVKAPLSEESLRLMEAYAYDLPFMPILREDGGVHERLAARRRLRYVGAEVLFTGDDSPLCGPDFVEKLHRSGRVLWANPIVYDARTLLTGAHTDDAALLGDPDRGWGFLLERGFDILQTDWPLALRLYGAAKYPARFAPVGADRKE